VNRIETNLYEPHTKMGMLALQFGNGVCVKIAAPEDDPLEVETCSAYYINKIRIVGGGVQAGSTRHVGHYLACCTFPG
jgi:hypothetical protein